MATIQKILRGKALKEYQDECALRAFGMTAGQAQAEGICVRCKTPPAFHSEIGEREYWIPALCEECFDFIGGKR